MAASLILKRSSVAGKVPSTAQLASGELAINTYDGKLFLKRVSGAESIIELGQTGPQGPQGPAGADGSPDTAAQVLAKLVTVDGPGSGLNADKLDGNQASAFARLSGATFTGTAVHQASGGEYQSVPGGTGIG